MWLVLLMACKHDDTDGATAATIVSDPNAPFPLDGRIVLFAAAAGNSDTSSRAMLLVTDGTVTCDDIGSQTRADISTSVFGEGDGLLFTPSWMSWAYYGQPSPHPEFTGLFRSYSQTTSGVYRSLGTQFWTTSYLYNIQAPSSFYTANDKQSWLRIDTLNPTTGAFQTPFWSGTFIATDCDDYDGDTGWQPYDTGIY